jgi:hypothetical protein
MFQDYCLNLKKGNQRLCKILKTYIPSIHIWLKLNEFIKAVTLPEFYSEIFEK